MPTTLSPSARRRKQREDQAMREIQTSLYDTLKREGVIPLTTGITKPVVQAASVADMFQNVGSEIARGYNIDGPRAMERGFTNAENSYGSRRYKSASRFSPPRAYAYDKTTQRRIRKGVAPEGQTYVGLEFNMDAPDARETFKAALGDQADFDKVKKGEQALNVAQMRRLFDAQVSENEFLIEAARGGRVISDNQRFAILNASLTNQDFIENIADHLAAGDDIGVMNEMLYGPGAGSPFNYSVASQYASFSQTGDVLPDFTSYKDGVMLKDRILMDNKGAIRNKPLDPKLANILNRAAAITGVDSVRVTSGGQSGGRRIGSTRHDHGNAADLELWVGGRALDMTNDADRPVMAKFVSASTAFGATGIGAGVAYMGTKRLHIGFGKQATWGAGGKGINAPGWLRDAVAIGQRQGNFPVAPIVSLKATKFQKLFTQAGSKYGVDPNLLTRMAQRESGFNPNAVSPAGARGLMQIMPGTAGDLGVDPMDPAQAVDGAARYMQQLMGRYNGNTRYALAAYNWGMGNVDSWIQQGASMSALPTETRNYVNALS